MPFIHATFLLLAILPKSSSRAKSGIPPPEHGRYTLCLSV